MEKFERPIQVRWSDMDPNFHVRHSVYYDFGAQLRTEFLLSQGLTAAVMQKHHFGPILFREEALFKRELKFGDQLRMNVMAASMRKDYSRFTIRHQILKDEDILCAELTVEGAWIDTIKRKLTVPPKEAQQAFEAFPRTSDFKWEELKGQK